jgi:WD40 repeat protein
MNNSIWQEVLLVVLVSMLGTAVSAQSEQRSFRFGDSTFNLEKLADLELTERERRYGPGIRAGGAGEYAFGSASGGIKVWNLRTGQSRLCAGEANRTYNRIALSKNGKFLAGYRNKKIYIWETSTCRTLKFLEVARDLNLYGLALSSNGKYLFYAHDDSRFLRSREKIVLWDIERGKEIANLQPERLPIFGSGYDPLFDKEALRPANGTFSPDSRILAVQYSYRIYLWNVEAGTMIRRLVDKSLDDEASQGGIYEVSFSEDGSMLLSRAADGTVKVWDVQTGDLKQTFRINDRVHGRASFSRDNRYVAAGDRKGEISVWEVSSGKMLWKQRLKSYLPLFSSPEVSLISVESGDIFDVRTGEKIEGIRGEFLSDGKLLVKQDDGNFSTWAVRRDR